MGSNPTIKYFLVFFPEPQTSLSPQVKDKEVGRVRKTVGQRGTAPLLCVAQGHPPPTFRYHYLCIVCAGCPIIKSVLYMYSSSAF